MSNESVKDFYDRQYSQHLAAGSDCPHAIHDLDKARRRVALVTSAFDVCLRGQALDVGSGLGYYTQALSEVGVATLGLDFSVTAIDAARARFPNCRLVCGAWPDAVAPEPQFDLVWMVNFSLMNSFDVEFIKVRLIDEALVRLKPGGCLIVGWNTDFSGVSRQGYSNWSLDTLAEIRRSCGLSDPFVPVPLGRWTSRGLTRFCKAIGRSTPIFMIRRK
jgi:SAM-dependent methyltransferase